MTNLHPFSKGFRKIGLLFNIACECDEEKTGQHMKYKIGIGVGCKAHYFSKP
jgi:hypothetical protein